MFDIVSIALQAENNTAPVFVLALVCVIVISSVGLAVLIGLARRVQQISDQGSRDKAPPDRSDDA